MNEKEIQSMSREDLDNLWRNSDVWKPNAQGFLVISEEQVSLNKLIINEYKRRLAPVDFEAWISLSYDRKNNDPPNTPAGEYMLNESIQLAIAFAFAELMCYMACQQKDRESGYLKEDASHYWSYKAINTFKGYTHACFRGRIPE